LTTQDLNGNPNEAIFAWGAPYSHDGSLPERGPTGVLGDDGDGDD
jgi:hypothetical protein